MSKINIKAELDAGAMPRELHERIRVEQRKTIISEISEGKWRCPRCGEPMKLSKESCVLYCDRHTSTNTGETK